MCKIFEDMQKEAVMKVALRMLRTGTYPLEEIVRISGLSLEEVQSLQAGHNA